MSGRASTITRRQALGGLAATITGFSLRSRRAYADATPNELRVASVGCGGKGWSDLNAVASAPSVRIVALCDVDDSNMARAHNRFKPAKTYRDYRRLFDEFAREIDAVIVSTPDHMHGSIALAAMSLGKHVYVQKPLAHNLTELRSMRDLAASKRLITQMGTQMHSHESYQTAVHLLKSGAIGRISEVHFWVGKVWAGPAEGRPPRSETPPPRLDWNLWLGVAPDRPFVAGLYHPDKWRGWRDFGTGTLGDMGCHLFDPIFAGLNLAAPTSIISRGPEHPPETYAPDSDLVFSFSGTPLTTDRLTFRWTNGKVKPDLSRGQFPKNLELPESGSFIVGEKCVMLLPHAGLPTFYRDGKKFEVPVAVHPSRNHYYEWVNACRGNGVTSTPFSFGCPVTETVLLGVIAGHYCNQELSWDSGRMRFYQSTANNFVSRKYREGWQIPGFS